MLSYIFAFATGGHIALLQHIKAHECQLEGTAVCCGAAQGGQLETLKWARSRGCAWDRTTCAFAAGGGHLEVLQWARANGCEWSWSTCSYAAAGGRLEVLRILLC